MGLCVSVGRSECDSSPTAKIVTVNGDLREYNVPVLASQVLEEESMASSSSSSSSRPSSYFLCDSDSLYYDDFIPVIEPEEILQADQIYFVFPVSKRQYRLTASDMAALAVKASVAMEKAAKNKNRRRNSGRISPVIMMNNQPNERTLAVNRSSTIMQKGNLPNKTTQFKSTNTIGYYGSGSVRQLKRYASGRARKLAARSIKRLSTIHEENIFLDF